MTARGAQLLREKLQTLGSRERAEIEELLASATIVHPPEDRSDIAFGAKVAVRDSTGEVRSYQIVGVDELDLHDHPLSWISPDGKALLAGATGERVTLSSGERVEIVGVEYPGE
jgi:transcription elongation GreA/GreB family factor